MAKILLVEDDETSREMLTLRLSLQGFDVITASDGGEAVDRAREAAREGNVDLVLMDMNLPVKDGWTVTRELKEMPETRDVPIIGVSAHAMTGDRDRAMKAGCDEYETKPVEWLRLLPKIEKLLSRRGNSGGEGGGQG